MLALPLLSSMRDCAELTGRGQLPVLDCLEEACGVVSLVKDAGGEAVLGWPRDGGDEAEAAFSADILSVVTFVRALVISSKS